MGFFAAGPSWSSSKAPPVPLIRGGRIDGRPSTTPSGIGPIAARPTIEMFEVQSLEEVDRIAVVPGHGSGAFDSDARLFQDPVACLGHDRVQVPVDGALGGGGRRAEPQVVGVPEG